MAEEIPVSTSARQTIDFDWDWKFIKGEQVDAEYANFDDSRWRQLDLPHDWSIEGPLAEDNPAGAAGGYLPGGIGWYRKHFTLPESDRGKKVLIQFDGVYWQSKVWINGHLLGFRPSGYMSFSYDLTEHLNYGGKENIIAVRVDNSRMPNERWYTGSGIYRHTRLVVTEPLRIKPQGLYVFADKIAGSKARVNVRTAIANGHGNSRCVVLTSRIFDPTGREITRHVTDADIAAGGEFEFLQQMEVGAPKLWSPGSPSLYSLRSVVTLDTETVDSMETDFGIRTVHFDADRGLFINGESTLIKGMCLHDDLGPLGTAFVDKSFERRLRMLKEMGCNAIRTAHNPPAPQVLDLCDHLGLLVVDEAFDKWAKPPGPLKDSTGYFAYFNEWHERDLRSFLRRDRNHPSIIMWSLGNEIGEQGLENGADTARRLKEIASEEDPSRLVTAGLNSINSAVKNGLAEVLDVIGYNGRSLRYYEGYHQKYPHWKFYGSEIPHSRDTRGVYKTTTLMEDPLPGSEYRMGDLAAEEVFPEFAEAYRSSYGNSYVRINALDSWRLCETRPYIAGEFRWTGFDYLGESGYAGGWPARSGDKGVFDLCGFRKDIYYFYKSRWTDEPMVHPLPHWTWPGKEGKTIPVWCYSNCESVELFLNGKSLGMKPLDVSKSYYLSWDVPYEPGVMSAVARRGGVAVAEKTVRSAGEPEQLSMSADMDQIAGDGRDVAHLAVTVVDANGNLVPHADQPVHFSIKGPGRIIGIGNGDILSHHDFQGRWVDSFHGMCLAIIQSERGKSGEIEVAAESPGLRTGIVRIKVNSTAAAATAPPR